MDAVDPRTEPRGHRRRRQRPDHPLLHRPVQRLAHEVLVGQRDQDRPPGVGHLLEAPRRLQAVPGVLPEVVAWVDHDPVGPHAQLHGPLGEAHGDPQDVRHHVVVRDPVRPGARLHTARMGAHQTGPVARRDLGELRVDAAPRVVQDVRACLADRRAHVVPPGVHADDDVGEPPAHLGHEADRAPRLLLGGDLRAGARLHPADVDDGRALGHRLLHAGERWLVVEGRTLVVEGVGGPVHDGHDHRFVRGELASSQPQRAAVRSAVHPLCPLLWSGPLSACDPNCQCRMARSDPNSFRRREEARSCSGSC